MANRRRLPPGITHLPSGLYQVRYRTPEGDQRKESFRLLEDARAFQAKTKVATMDGTYVERSGKTFAQIAQEWLASNPTKRRTPTPVTPWSFGCTSIRSSAR